MQGSCLVEIPLFIQEPGPESWALLCLAGVPSTYTNVKGRRKEDCNGLSREKLGSVFSEHLWCAVVPFICKQLSEALRQNGAHRGKQLGSKVSSTAFQLCGLRQWLNFPELILSLVKWRKLQHPL